MPRRSRNGGPRSSHTLRPVRRRKKMHGLRPFASWSARSCEKTTRWPKRPRGAFSKKKSTRSGGADTRSQSDRVGSERGAGAGAEAVAQGSRQHTACEMVGVHARTRHRCSAHSRPRMVAGGRARLHGIRSPVVSVTRLWRWRHALSFAIRARIRWSHVWRTEANILRQRRPFTAF